MFAAHLDQSVDEQSFFSADLWRDDYVRPTIAVVDKKTVGFATCYAQALEHYQEPLRQLDFPRICIYCHIRYTEKENIGTWRCVYHPFFARDGEFPCCGLRSAHGCTPCDHTDEHPVVSRWTEENSQIRIPTILRNTLQYPANAIAQTVKATDPLFSYDNVNRVAKRV